MEILHGQTLTRTAIVTYETFDGIGNLLDSTFGKPINLPLDEGEMHPQLKSVLLTMQPGDQRTIHLSAGEAWGHYDPALIFETTEMATGCVPGDCIQLADGREGTVVKVNGTIITIDTNHPFAGKDLTINISLIGWMPGNSQDNTPPAASGCCGPAGCC